MKLFEVFFEDGGKDRISLMFMSTEKFRLENGGKSNIDLILEHVQKIHPGRAIKKIVRLLNGQTIYERAA